MLKFHVISGFMLSCYCSIGFAKYEADAGSLCDGYPRVNVQTIDSLCIGLVVDENSGVPFVKPRDLLEIDNHLLLVTDMGGWKKNNGKLYLIEIKNLEKIKYKVVHENLNYPHTILFGPDHRVYIGMADRISRIKYDNGGFSNLETVIENLPFDDKYLHPLKSFIFDQDNNLIVNIGAPSDRCSDEMKSGTCKEAQQAGLVKYEYEPGKQAWNATPIQYASGLRNSLALAIHSTGTILQGENGIDYEEADRPYEELNVIQGGQFYGWPYCYDILSVTDGWHFDCSGAGNTKPWVLLPPHTAPLSMFYYQGDRLKPLKGKLIMALHGYRIAGHRLVAFDIDEQGRPIKSKKAGYWTDPLDPAGVFTYKEFSVSSEEDMVAVPVEITTRWNAVQGVRPKGAPSSIKEANDGAVWIVDDKNKAILRLSSGEAYRDRKVKSDPKSAANHPPPATLEKFSRYCGSCHTEIVSKPEVLLNADSWLREEDGITILEDKLQKQQMPPDKKLSPEVIKELTSWIQPPR